MLWISTTEDKAWQEMEPKPAADHSGEDLALTGERDQVWAGFGGCFNEMGWSVLLELPENERNAVMEALYGPDGECRFNIGRLPIGASDYALKWYSHNENDGDYAMERFSIERDQAFLIPYIRSALDMRPDIKLYASPWSPPTWMKHPAVYNYGTLIREKRNLDAYALYFLKFVRAYRKEGIRIAGIHVQNEPGADQKFPSCLWTGTELCDFIRHHLGPLFRKEKEECEIWLGTINMADYDCYVNPVLSNPAARAFLSGVGYQWYGKYCLGPTRESWPQIRLMQTENECGDGTNNWDYAQYVFTLLRHYINHGVDSYLYWNMILPPGGRSSWGWTQNSMITVGPGRKISFNPEYQVMRHFSRFIEPGSVRLDLKGAWAGNAVAFVRPEGGTVLVMANPFPETRRCVFNTGREAVCLDLPGRSFNTLVDDELS